MSSNPHAFTHSLTHSPVEVSQQFCELLQKRWVRRPRRQVHRELGKAVQCLPIHTTPPRTNQHCRSVRRYAHTLERRHALTANESSNIQQQTGQGIDENQHYYTPRISNDYTRSVVGQHGVAVISSPIACEGLRRDKHWHCRWKPMSTTMMPRQGRLKTCGQCDCGGSCCCFRGVAARPPAGSTQSPLPVRTPGISWGR